MSNAKKKVLVYSLDYYPGAVGGAESAIKDITDRISPEEIEFHLVTLYYEPTKHSIFQMTFLLCKSATLTTKLPAHAIIFNMVNIVGSAGDVPPILN